METRHNPLVRPLHLPPAIIDNHKIKSLFAEQWPVYVELTNDKVFGCDFVVSATGVTPFIQPFISDNNVSAYRYLLYIVLQINLWKQVYLIIHFWNTQVQKTYKFHISIEGVHK